MKDLFFIIKGSYVKGAEPSVINSVNKDTYYIGGYDPYDHHTKEWYMAVDNITYTTISCGGDLDKVLESVYKVIKRYKGDTKKYLKGVRSSDTKESPIMQELRKHIYDEYGEYYSEDIKRMEERAFSEMKEEKPVLKNRKLVSKVNTLDIESPKKEVINTTPTLKKVMPKPKLGLKRLK